MRRPKTEPWGVFPVNMSRVQGPELPVIFQPCCCWHSCGHPSGCQVARLWFQWRPLFYCYLLVWQSSSLKWLKKRPKDTWPIKKSYGLKTSTSEKARFLTDPADGLFQPNPNLFWFNKLLLRLLSTHNMMLDRREFQDKHLRKKIIPGGTIKCK